MFEVNQLRGGGSQGLLFVACAYPRFAWPDALGHAHQCRLFVDSGVGRRVAVLGSDGVP
jgi:hypothetical protein